MYLRQIDSVVGIQVMGYHIYKRWLLTELGLVSKICAKSQKLHMVCQCLHAYNTCRPFGFPLSTPIRSELYVMGRFTLDLEVAEINHTTNWPSVDAVDVPNIIMCLLVEQKLLSSQLPCQVRRHMVSQRRFFESLLATFLPCV